MKTKQPTGEIDACRLAQEEAMMLEPYRHICKRKGKQLRSGLIEALNHWFRLPEKTVAILQEVTGMLHNASLIVDDIQDNSNMRRGAPVAHAIYGLGATIIASNYICCRAFDRLLHSLPTKVGTEAVKILLNQLLKMHLGQGAEIHWRDTGNCPSEKQYVQMVERKTGAMFGLCVQLMQLLCDEQQQAHHQDYTRLISLMGAYYQVRDDYANLKSDQYEDTKGFCEDLTEGKFSFPVIYALHHAPSHNVERLLNILKQHTTSRQIKTQALLILEQAGAFEYTQKRLAELYEDIQAEIHRLGGNSRLSQLWGSLRTDL